MKHSRFTLFMMLCWVILVAPMMVSAQVGGPSDRDGDGLPDSVDRCPDDFGSRELMGCPDSDGDGIADIDDLCPFEAGPLDNRGCPVVVEQPPQEQPQQPSQPEQPQTSVNSVRPVIGGACQLATYLSTAVNIRASADPNATIVGTLNPAVLYDVYGMMLVEGNAWYLVDGGWVNGIAVVLGGNCGGMSNVRYYPDFALLLGSDFDPRRFCFDIFGLEVCFGTGPVVLSDGSLGGPGPDTQKPDIKKVCKGIKGKIVCFLVEEVIFAIWDWFNEDTLPFDPTTHPDVLVFDPGQGPTEPDADGKVPKQICKTWKGKVICWIVEEVISAFIDWLLDDDVAPVDPFNPSVFVPTPPTNTGDARPSVPNDLPMCDKLLNDLIMQHIPADGSSPIQTSIRGDYLIIELIFIPEIPLPQKQPCIKWVNGAIDEAGGELDGYLVEYASWPPNGFPILDNSTVPLYALLLPAVQKVREAATYTPWDGALMVDFLSQTSIDENGGIFFGFDVPGATEAGYLKIGDIKGESQD